MTFTVAFWFTYLALIFVSVGNIVQAHPFNLGVGIVCMTFIGFFTMVWYWNGWQSKF